MYRVSVFVFALLLSACTIQPQNGDLNAQFHMPLVYQDWQTEYYMAHTGEKACAISSGYNGISVMLGTQSGTAVKSNRLMKPGTELTVSVGDENFRTSDVFFPAPVAQKLVDQLAKGGKAYMEWSEPGGPLPAAGRMRVQNIVKLDNFKSELEKCRGALKSGNAQP